jgi:general stress protein YciG
MDKNVSIVKVDKRHHRVIARENWGLTKEQMRGKHVHHRIKRCDGGTNDPSNLYVCSPSFHRWGWHDGEEFVEWASKGAEVANFEKDEDGKSLTARKGGKATMAEKDKDRKSLNARKAGKTSDASKTPEQKTILGRIGGYAAAAAMTSEQKQERSRKAGEAAAIVMTQKQKQERGKKGGRASSLQVWESLIDGFRGNAGNVAQHNHRLGKDPNARVKVG